MIQITDEMIIRLFISAPRSGSWLWFYYRTTCFGLVKALFSPSEIVQHLLIKPTYRAGTLCLIKTRSARRKTKKEELRYRLPLHRCAVGFLALPQLSAVRQLNNSPGQNHMTLINTLHRLVRLFICIMLNILTDPLCFNPPEWAPQLLTVMAKPMKTNQCKGLFNQ